MFRRFLPLRLPGIPSPRNQVERGPQLPRGEVQAVGEPDGANGGAWRVVPAILPSSQCGDRDTQNAGQSAVMTVNLAKISQHYEGFLGIWRMFAVHALLWEGFDAHREHSIAK